MLKEVVHLAQLELQQVQLSSWELVSILKTSNLSKQIASSEGFLDWATWQA